MKIYTLIDINIYILTFASFLIFLALFANLRVEIVSSIAYEYVYDIYDEMMRQADEMKTYSFHIDRGTHTYAHKDTLHSHLSSLTISTFTHRHAQTERQTHIHTHIDTHTSTLTHRHTKTHIHTHL